MTFPISFVKPSPRDTNLNPVVDYINETQLIRHDADRGLVEGTQLYLIKTLANAGDTNIKITPHNGQSLVAAFSFSQSALINWVNSDGIIVSGLGIHSISGADFTKLIENSDGDQYVWFGVAELGNVGTPAIHPSYTYTVEYSGNYTSPEAILKSTGVPGPLPTGLYSNPAVIGPNSTGTYNSTYGDCISGSYYLTFQAIGNIIRNLTVTTNDSSEFGIVVSSSKDEAKNWILNNGAGPLTDGGNYTSVGGSLIIDTEVATTKSMYAIFYDSANIGNPSCIGGKSFNIVSVQESESGSNNGTYANPYAIGNNVTQDLATLHSRHSGECRSGASYYSISTCSGVPIDVTVYSSNMSNVGIAVATTKAILADFIKTGNPSNLVIYEVGGAYENVTVSFLATTYQYYAIVYDPSNMNVSSCGSSDSFTVWTKQLNCAGGGSSRNGRFNSPYEGNYWSGVLHADGDCDVDGRIWFRVNTSCYSAPMSIRVSPNGGQTIGVAWANNQYDVKNFLDGGGGSSGGSSGGGGSSSGGGSSMCGYFDNSYNPEMSDYYDYYGNYYQIIDYSVWYGYSDDQYYYNKSSLPNYCSGSGGGSSSYYSGSSSSNSSVSYRTSSSYISATFSNSGTIYVAIYIPGEGAANQCGNYKSFNISVEAENCSYYGSGSNGNYVLGERTDPYVISNNMAQKYIPNYVGECGNGNFYMQAYVCQNNTLTFNTSTDNQSVLAWSDNLQALIEWRDSGFSGSVYDYGATDGGSSDIYGEYSPSFTANPIASGLYYFLLTCQVNTCTDYNSSFMIETSQGECDGSSLGTYASPVGVSSGDTVVMSLGDGACFDNRIYYATQLCADTSASAIITPSSYSHKQGYMYGPDLALLKQNVNTLYSEGYFFGIPDGGYYVDVGYQDTPITANIAKSNKIRDLYFVVFEYPESGYGNLIPPRCGSTDSVSFKFNQNCPIVDIGGSQGISGANVYNIDPYGPSGSKTGIALIEGDPARNYDASLMYSPIIIIDQASAYPTVTCSSISATLYVNKVNGFTEVVQTKSTSSAKVLYDNINDTVLIKPMVGSELIFQNASFYTGLIRTTFTTNVGTFTRNQVINAGSTFTNGREQYSYVIASSGANMTIVIPVIDEYVHTLITSNGDISSTYTMDKYNTVKVTMTPQLPLNSVLEIPFKTANSSTVRTAKVIVK